MTTPVPYGRTIRRTAERGDESSVAHTMEGTIFRVPSRVINADNPSASVKILPRRNQTSSYLVVRWQVLGTHAEKRVRSCLCWNGVVILHRQSSEEWDHRVGWCLVSQAVDPGKGAIHRRRNGGRRTQCHVCRNRSPLIHRCIPAVLSMDRAAALVCAGPGYVKGFRCTNDK